MIVAEILRGNIPTFLRKLVPVVVTGGLDPSHKHAGSGLGDDHVRA